MEGTLNLSPFGDIIENPRKKEQIDIEIELPVKQVDPPGGFTFNQFRKNIEPDHSVQLPKSEFTKQSEIACKILKNSSQVKLFHWQTCSYAEHKTLDKFLDSFMKLSDDFMESVMGKYGRPELAAEHRTLEIVNYNSQPISNFMDMLYECYSCEVKDLLDPTKDSELINILDEIVALIDKTKYLLTLK